MSVIELVLHDAEAGKLIRRVVARRHVRTDNDGIRITNHRGDRVCTPTPSEARFNFVA